MELFSSKTSAPRRVVEDNVTKEQSAKVEGVDETQGNGLVSASSRGATTAYSFQELGLNEWLCKSTASLGYRRPTTVQAGCIPGILQGKDVMACAETGSGKTAAFVLPMLQILSEDPYGIFGVILTPTRELAQQISDQIVALGASLHVTTALVIGGVNMIHQGIALARRPHFVIATPGRLRHHLEGADPPSIRKCRFLVLDEADRLLALGFSSELSIILQHINPKRQTLLFSATLTQTLGELQSLALRDNALQHNSTHEVAGQSGFRQLPATLTQQYAVVPTKLKVCYLILVLSRFFAKSLPEGTMSLSDAVASKKATDKHDKEQQQQLRQKQKAAKNRFKFSGKDREMEIIEQLVTRQKSGGKGGEIAQVIIFVESCHRCHELSLTLQELLRNASAKGFLADVPDVDNLGCVALHGMMTQQQRMQALQSFRDVTARILVATDVASRGLDLQAVALVISYDLPRVAADYVHRAGRTARAGRVGSTLTFVTPHDIALLQSIESSCNTRLEAFEDVKITDAQPLLLPVSKAMQTVQLAILASDFVEREEKFQERKKRQRDNHDKKEEAGDEDVKDNKERHKKKARDIHSDPVEATEDDAFSAARVAKLLKSPGGDESKKKLKKAKKI